ncbi:MAG: nitrile hydratase subunit alpha [Pseudomonadota bacterium]
MSDEHDHDHHHAVPSDTALRVKALETVLTQRGLVESDAIDAIVDLYENQVGPRNGASVVARAWSNAAFKSRLLNDASAACAELGVVGVEGTHLKVVENTDDTHNMVVCTLCSCYPWSLLGLPPRWYKSFAYRSRAVSEPRTVLREFGIELEDNTAVQVWDSTAELRYLVLPKQPPEWAELSEEVLIEKVTRNGMIGTALV